MDSSGFIDIAIKKSVGVTLPFFYFFFVKEGAVDFIINGEKTVAVKENCGIFVNKSIDVNIDYNSINSDRPADISTIRVTSEIISRFNYLNYIRSGFNMGNLKSNTNVNLEYCFFDFRDKTDSERKVLYAIAREIEKENTQSIQTCGKNSMSGNSVLSYEYGLLLSILLKTNINCAQMLHANSTELVSEKAAKLIISDYGCTWNIKKLSEALYMSESTFKKKMYKEVGAVNDFINRIKVVEALRRLRRTSDSLTVIAEDLGFCSNSYFTQVFFKQLGVLPSVIRTNFKTSSER